MKTEIRDERGRFRDGNPGGPGRPIFSIVSIIKRKLQEVPEGEAKSLVELMAEEYLNNARNKRDGPAIRDIIDRFDGKPHQTLTVNNEADTAWLEFLKSVGTEPEPEATGDPAGLLGEEAEAPST